MKDDDDARRPNEPLLSLRMYLLIKALERGASFAVAWEAVSTTLMSITPRQYDPAMRYYEQWEALHAHHASTH